MVTTEIYIKRYSPVLLQFFLSKRLLQCVNAIEATRYSLYVNKSEKSSVGKIRCTNQ